MPISGLVVIFERSFPRRDETIALLDAEPAIEVGVVNENKCALVLETHSKDQDQKVSRWVRDLPGVADVQIAFIGFDEPTDKQPTDKQLHDKE